MADAARKPEEDDDGFEIEVVDERSEEDKREPSDHEGDDIDAKESRKAKHERDDDGDPDDDDDDDDDDEVKDYSKKVQKRIKQLTWKHNEERRKAEDAQRLREEAIRFAQAQHEENEKLRRMLAQGERGMVETASARYKAELDAAKAAYRAAYDEGDTDKIIEAQARIAEITSAAQRWKDYRPRFTQQQRQPQQQQQQQRPQVPKPDERAMKWAEKNPWFQNDHKMTAYAFGVHQELISEKGVDPSTDEYYSQLNKEMRKAFPDYFGQRRSQPSSDSQATVVAPASKSQKTPRRVTLTRSQVELAKRLNITPEQYAAQILKDMEK